MTNRFTRRSAALLVPILMVVLALPGVALASGGRPPPPPPPTPADTGHPAECRTFHPTAQLTNPAFGIGQCVKRGDTYVTLLGVEGFDDGWNLSLLLSSGSSRRTYNVLVAMDIPELHFPYVGTLYQSDFLGFPASIKVNFSANGRSVYLG